MMKRTILTMLLTAAPALLAQDAAPPTKTGRSPRHGDSAAVVSLEFPGGTLEVFVAAVRKSEPRANVVLAIAAREARVPPMVLKDAGLEQALEGACEAAEADFDVRVRQFAGRGEPVFSITADARRARRSTTQSANGAARGGDAQERLQKVFSLNELTARRAAGVEPMPVRTILSAIDLAMAGEREQPRIRFHEDSGLLLVRGTPEQLGTVHELLQVLQQDMAKRENRAIQQQFKQDFNGNKEPGKDR